MLFKHSAEIPVERFLLEQEIAMCVISHDVHFVQKLGITKRLTLK